MELFREKLCRMVPVVKRTYNAAYEIGAKMQFAFSENIPEGDYYSLPYLQPVEEFCQKCDGIVGKRIFIITEEENIGIKAALGVVGYPLYEEWDHICSQIGLLNYDRSDVKLQGSDGSSFRLRLICFEGEKKGNEQAENYYFSLIKGVSVHDSVFFWGLEDGPNLEEKLDIIMGCEAEIQFVMLQKDQLGKPWVRDLMMDRESDVIVLPRIENAYYEEILSELLDGERFRLDETISPERLIQSIRKNRGVRFAEEDIAWSLDQAVKHGKKEGQAYILTGTDFSMEQWEQISPLRKLQGMVGLENVKNLAVEYAALSQEQGRNQKLSGICKHVIFKGKPGTGKTMCGKLLAQIMSEQGQSCGSFVVAERKDIIGQYLGQTAPKIAKLFKAARNGVIFVDEAGFFLQERRDGYAQEAVKEFVRYMELFQDVMVIFALYPQEVEDWLQLDAGLSSRIGKIVEFSDYSEKELLQIAEYMCRSKGYRIAEGSAEIISSYIADVREQSADQFGNAREVRKLIESAILARSLRYFNRTPKEKEFLLTAIDFENGVRRLRQDYGKKKIKVGFALPGVVYGEG